MRWRKERGSWAARAVAGWWPWALLSAALYASGNRSARRAALRGLLSSALSTLLVGGADGVRGRRRIAATAPGAAGAFGTAIALEMREAAPPTALASAGAVAASLRSGFPDPSAWSGAALGAGVAVATTRIWPIRPAQGPHAPKVWLPSDAEPTPEGDGLVVVVNTASGNGDSPTEEIKAALPEADVVEVDPDRGDELRKVLDERADHTRAIGVSGGDGSINTAAQVALDEDKPLVVFPTGTFNHLTGALGVERIEDSVAAVKSGEAVGVDVATIDGKVFLNTASFGGYVEFVDARERLERRIGKWPAVVVALVRVLRSYDPVAVEIDGKPAKVWMAFIGNCRYHPSGFAPSWRERFDDELLDFRYVDGSAPLARLRLILAVLTGRLGRSKIYLQTCVERLTLSSNNGPLRLARDGETFEGSDEMVVEKLPKRLAVYVPHSKKS